MEELFIYFEDIASAEKVARIICQLEVSFRRAFVCTRSSFVSKKEGGVKKSVEYMTVSFPVDTETLSREKILDSIKSALRKEGLNVGVHKFSPLI